MQHIIYTSDSSSMEYRDNYSQVDQAMEGDNTHGSYKVRKRIKTERRLTPVHYLGDSAWREDAERGVFFCWRGRVQGQGGVQG